MKLTVSNASSNDAEIMAPSSVISSSITKPLLDNLKKVQIKLLSYTWVVPVIIVKCDGNWAFERTFHD